MYKRYYAAYMYTYNRIHANTHTQRQRQRQRGKRGTYTWHSFAYVDFSPSIYLSLSPSISFNWDCTIEHVCSSNKYILLCGLSFNVCEYICECVRVCMCICDEVNYAKLRTTYFLARSKYFACKCFSICSCILSFFLCVCVFYASVN